MEPAIGVILILPLLGALLMPWASKLGRRWADGLVTAVMLGLFVSA